MTALLLADSEPTSRSFLAQQLTSDGFDVLAFESPDQLPRAAEPDVLVLGDADALDRCVVPDCPVIVIGRADPATRLRALERCDDYLSRPYVYEELVGLFASNLTSSLHLFWLEQGLCGDMPRLRTCREATNRAPNLRNFPTTSRGRSKGRPIRPRGRADRLVQASEQRRRAAVAALVSCVRSGGRLGG